MQAFLEADAPRVACSEHGPTVAQVPWAAHRARHTFGFEALVAWLAVRLSKTAIQELLRVGWATVGVIIDRVVARDRAVQDPFDGLVRIGIDEISSSAGTAI